MACAAVFDHRCFTAYPEYTALACLTTLPATVRQKCYRAPWNKHSHLFDYQVLGAFIHVSLRRPPPTRSTR